MELLAVVLIIGILAAIALPQYRKAVMKARFSELKVFTRALAAAEDRYFFANNAYTTDISLLDIDFPQTPTSVEENVYHFKTYNFDWGSCTLIDGSVDGEPRATCSNPDINMIYGAQFSYVPSTASAYVKNHAGKYRCKVRVPSASNASLAAQICKQETRSDPDGGGDYWY